MTTGLAFTDPDDRFNLDNYENRARCFFHEVTHLDYFVDAPDTDQHVWDWRVTIKTGKKVESSAVYNPYWTKILARYVTRSLPTGTLTQASADNFAQYTLAKFVKANGLGDHPYLPTVSRSLKPIRMPQLVKPIGISSIEFDLDTDGSPIFNDTEVDSWVASDEAIPCEDNVTGNSGNNSLTVDGFLDDTQLGESYIVEKMGWLANAFTFGEMTGLNLRILPLGGNQVEMIGSVRAGTMSNNQNEGQNGYEIDQISDAVTETLPQRPNVVLLHAGTNDMNNNDDVANAPTRLGNLVDKIISACPDAAIFVAKIIPSGAADTQARIVDFNTALPDVVSSCVAQGYKVFLVDQYSLLYSPNDYADDLHPNDQGYMNMATAWYNTIAYTNFDLGWITTPVAGSDPGKRPSSNPLQQQSQLDRTGTTDPAMCDCGSLIEGPAAYSTTKVGSDCRAMGYSNVHAVHFADLDGDGRAEYLWVGPNGEVHAFYNQGPPQGQESLQGATVGWWDAGQIASGVGARREEVRFADLNGDGRAEYIWVHPNGSASTPANVGWYQQGLVADGIGYPGASIRFADLNGDGRAEYIALDSNGGAIVYLNLGPAQGTDPHGAQVGWLPQTQTATGVGGNVDQTVFADVNGDGRADYLFFPEFSEQARGAVSLWLNGDAPDDGPHAGERVWIEMGSITGGDGTSALRVMFADLNADGRAEYLEVDPATSAVTAYLNGC
ncbi:hypothetical protein MMC11_002801 [Xylographa trunciseda]|nr:hypothetical protein [Xylographa trunciseda]